MRRVRSSSLQEVNILPLIDVLFLLLAFFIVLTASMVMQRSMPVNLAKAESGAKASADDNSISIALKESGLLFVEKEEITQANLLDVLKARKEEKPDATVFLSADKKATHEMFTGALDQIRKSGFQKVSITVAPK